MQSFRTRARVSKLSIQGSWFQGFGYGLWIGDWKIRVCREQNNSFMRMTMLQPSFVVADDVWL